MMVAEDILDTSLPSPEGGSRVRRASPAPPTA